MSKLANRATTAMVGTAPSSFRAHHVLCAAEVKIESKPTTPLKPTSPKPVSSAALLRSAAADESLHAQLSGIPEDAPAAAAAAAEKDEPAARLRTGFGAHMRHNLVQLNKDEDGKVIDDEKERQFYM